jgi:hypothetical protein
MRGKVPLLAWHSYPLSKEDGKHLWELLVQWMEPKYEFRSGIPKFLAKQTLGQPGIDLALRKKYRRYLVPSFVRANAKLVDLHEAGAYLEEPIWCPF